MSFLPLRGQLGDAVEVGVLDAGSEQTHGGSHTKRPPCPISPSKSQRAEGD